MSILKYFKLTTDLYKCKSGSKTEDLILDELDKIYLSLSESERDYISNLLCTASENYPTLSRDEIITLILNQLEDAHDKHF